MHRSGPVPDERLFAILAILIRYDGGAYRDRGGVRDGEGYWALKDWLEGLDADALRLTLARFVRETYLTETRLAMGEGIAGALRALDWLSLEMGIDVSKTLPARDGPSYRLRSPS